MNTALKRVQQHLEQCIQEEQEPCKMEMVETDLVFIPASREVNIVFKEVRSARFSHLVLKMLQEVSKPLKCQGIWTDPEQVHLLQLHVKFRIQVFVPRMHKNIPMTQIEISGNSVF